MAAAAVSEASRTQHLRTQILFETSGFFQRFAFAVEYVSRDWKTPEERTARLMERVKGLAETTDHLAAFDGIAAADFKNWIDRTLSVFEIGRVFGRGEIQEWVSFALTCPSTNEKIQDTFKKAVATALNIQILEFDWYWRVDNCFLKELATTKNTQFLSQFLLDSGPQVHLPLLTEEDDDMVIIDSPDKSIRTDRAIVEQWIKSPLLIFEAVPQRISESS